MATKAKKPAAKPAPQLVRLSPAERQERGAEALRLMGERDAVEKAGREHAAATRAQLKRLAEQIAACRRAHAEGVEERDAQLELPAAAAPAEAPGLGKLIAALTGAPDELALERAWEDVVAANHHSSLTDADMERLDVLFNERQGQLRAAERAANGGELREAADEDAADELSDPDPEEVVRQSGNGHVIVMRTGDLWRRMHRGIVKGDASRVWGAHAKPLALDNATEVRWYVKGLLAQTFDGAAATAGARARKKSRGKRQAAAVSV